MVFNNSDAGNLFNTETMTLGSLGLSASASITMEVISLKADAHGLYIDNLQTWVPS